MWDHSRPPHHICSPRRRAPQCLSPPQPRAGPPVAVWTLPSSSALHLCPPTCRPRPGRPAPPSRAGRCPASPPASPKQSPLRDGPPRPGSASASPPRPRCPAPLSGLHSLRGARSLRGAMLRAESWPPKTQVEVLTPRTPEGDCIWRWAFKDVIKLKRGLEGGPRPRATGVLVRGEDTDVHGAGTTRGHSLHAEDGARGERPPRLRLGLPANSAAGRPLSPGLWHSVCSPRTRVS